MNKIDNVLDLKMIRRIFMPLLLSLLIISIKIIYEASIRDLTPAYLQSVINKFLLTAIAISVGVLAQRISGFIMLWYERTIASKTETTVDEELIPLLQKSLNIAISIAVIITVLPFYGVNINALITAIGVGSLAIALAAKDTISNIIAGFLIMTDRPFRIGDKVKIPSGEIVEVLDIGTRRSMFLADDKSVIIIPNIDLSSQKIINFTYGKKYK